MLEMQEKIKIKTKYCPCCGSDDVTTRYLKANIVSELIMSKHISFDEIHEKWTPVDFSLPVIYCRECVREYEISESDDARHDASCVSLGLLSPQQIKAIRRKHGFRSAEKFSSFLGLGAKTVTQWEARRRIPNKSSVILIKIFHALGTEGFKECLQKHKDEIKIQEERNYLFVASKMERRGRRKGIKNSNGYNKNPKCKRWKKSVSEEC